LTVERRAPDWDAHADARPAFVTPRTAQSHSGEPPGGGGCAPVSGVSLKARSPRAGAIRRQSSLHDYRDGKVACRFRAVVGTASTPTPQGRFFIEEAVALSPVDLGGPFALATSARSNVLQEFAGGPGQIALHGTAGLSDALGTAASHGCLPLSTGAITWLARRIGSGVSLRITG
jgi:hypothetical protein